MRTTFIFITLWVVGFYLKLHNIDPAKFYGAMDSIACIVAVGWAITCDMKQWRKK